MNKKNQNRTGLGATQLIQKIFNKSDAKLDYLNSSDTHLDNQKFLLFQSFVKLLSHYIVKSNLLFSERKGAPSKVAKPEINHAFIQWLVIYLKLFLSLCNLKDAFFH